MIITSLWLNIRISIVLVFLVTAYGNAKIQVTTTLQPFKEILEAIVGDRGEVIALLPAGASPHTHELRPSEMASVEKSDIFFFGATNLDGWALKILNSRKVALIDLVEKKELLDFTADNPGDTHFHAGIDPHFWTDPVAVNSMIPQLVQKLCQIDSSGCIFYRANGSKFADRLDSLNKKIEMLLDPVSNKNVLLSHPFFRYFLKRYGFNLVGYVESIPGAETTPRELKEKIEMVRKENVAAVLTHPQLPDRPAKLVAEAAGIPVVELDPLGGEAGKNSYEALILYNAKILKEALK